MSDSQELQDTAQPDDPVADTSAGKDAAAERSAPPPPPGAAAGPYPGEPYPHNHWHRRRREIFDPRRKSAGLACVLSFMPGLGQVYIGNYQRGFVHLIVVACTISLLAEGYVFRPLEPLLILFLIFFWLYNIVDAGRRAAFYNRAIEGGEEIELPRDLPVLGTSGTLFAGIGLLAVGVILLLHNLDFALEWLEDWWPVAPIALGLYLIAKALRDRVKAA